MMNANGFCQDDFFRLFADALSLSNLKAVEFTQHDRNLEHSAFQSYTRKPLPDSARIIIADGKPLD